MFRNHLKKGCRNASLFYIYKLGSALKVIEAKGGKKFKPGDFVYVKRILQSDRIGMIIRYHGNIDSYETKERQEIYEVLIGKEMRLFNEILLESISAKINEKILRSPN